MRWRARNDRGRPVRAGARAPARPRLRGPLDRPLLAAADPAPHAPAGAAPAVAGGDLPRFARRAAAAILLLDRRILRDGEGAVHAQDLFGALPGAEPRHH